MGLRLGLGAGMAMGFGTEIHMKYAHMYLSADGHELDGLQYLAQFSKTVCIIPDPETLRSW